MKVIIVGGGVAGLHVGIRLASRGVSCCILDEYHCGGRIQTYESDGYHWENGAGRISLTHTMTMKYIKRYGLHTIPLPDQIDYLSTQIVPNPFFDMHHILKIFESVPPSVLSHKTMKELLKEVMPHETDFYKAFPYYAELSVLRADLALESFAAEMGTHKRFVVCKEGLSALIAHMKEEFIELGGTIIENMRVHGVETVNHLTFIHAHDRITKKRAMYSAPICVLAIPSYALAKLVRIPSVTSVLRHLTMVPLLRIYMVFPKDNPTKDNPTKDNPTKDNPTKDNPTKDPTKSWFSDLKSTVVDGPIRYMIPINDTCIMISYTEGPYATHWMNMEPAEVQRQIMAQVRDLFPEKDIPDPIFMKMHRWRQGCTYWVPGSYDVDHMSRKILNPKKGLFVCGESYARKQCWIESALEHAEMLLTYHLNNTVHLNDM
jgi:hypothetical protein